MDKTGLSLRYKLLILLTMIPIVCLSLYLWMASQLFKSDKEAYIQESTTKFAQSLSIQVKLQINTHLKEIKSLSEKYILTDYVDGRWIYWEYKEPYELVKKILIKQETTNN